MKAVIGLGNPGMKYDGTKHNVGFMLLDRLAESDRLKYRNDFRGKVAEGIYGKERTFFLKPYTYMNLSGLAVAQLAGYYKIPATDIIVIHDDMDIPLGRIKLRPQGGSGGHNGIKSIIAELNTQDFWRLRIGVGRPKEDGDAVNHVLSSFGKVERTILNETLERASEALLMWLNGRGDEAMNLHNRQS